MGLIRDLSRSASRMRLAGPGAAGNQGQLAEARQRSRDPLWQNMAATLAFRGDGSDGDVTISTNTTLTRDMCYNNLTVNSGVRLNPGGYRIFVLKKLINWGTIARNGNNGSMGASGGGLAAGSLGGAAAGGTPTFTYEPGGGGGAGVVVIAADEIQNKGIISVNGGQGGTSTGEAVANQNGVAGGSITTSLGAGGGAGGSSGVYSGGAGGTATAPPASAGGFLVLPQAIELFDFINATRVAGGAGGGTGAGSVTTGGWGGGGGGGGGCLVLVYRKYSGEGTKTATGGVGGAQYGNAQAGSAGSPGTVLGITY